MSLANDPDLETPAQADGNAKAYSVSELAFALKRTLETAYGFVRLRGELSKVTFHSNGHVYLSIKDEKACIDGVVWKGGVRGLGVRPEQGMEVIVTGKVTTYPAGSRYQIVIESMEPAGVGALLAQLEKLKAKLQAEGLFDIARKRTLPSMPEVVGVITSPTGAVIRDILHRIRDRWPCRVVVWPVVVQGEQAASQVIAAIEGFNGLGEGGPMPRPDILIVARGGGSVEDLWPFNDERLARAAASSAIPLISAVGHETDTTLIDFVSDRRAPTPTAAAEMAIPARADLLADLAQKAARLAGALAHVTRDRRLRLLRAERLLPDLPSLLGTARQRLDDRGDRLALALPNLLERRRAALVGFAGRMPDLPAMLLSCRERVRDRGGRLVLALPNLVTMRRHALGLAEQRLLSGLRQAVGSVHQRAGRVLGRLTDSVPRAALREARVRLDGTSGRLESVSPLAVLARGYALVTDPKGAPITQAAVVKPGARMRLRFADGEVRATADGGRPADRQGMLPL